MLFTFDTIKDYVFNERSINLGLKDIVSPPYYLKTDSVFYNPLDQQPNTLYIENTNGMKIEFSEQYELKAVVTKLGLFEFNVLCREMSINW